MRKIAARKYRDKYLLALLVIFFFYTTNAESQLNRHQHAKQSVPASLFKKPSN